MSRQTITVTFPDGIKRYGLYNGTSDTVWPALFDTATEAWDAKDRLYNGDWEPFAEVFFPNPEGDIHPVLIKIDNGTPEIPGRATRNAVISPLDADGIYDIIETLGDAALLAPASADPEEES